MRRHETGTARGQDQAIVGQSFSRGEGDLLAATIDLGGMRIQPASDLSFVVPGFRLHIQPAHGRTSIDQAGDRHAIIEVVLFPADEMNLTLGMMASHIVGGGDAGRAIADDDDALEAAIIIGHRHRRRDCRGGLGVE